MLLIISVRIPMQDSRIAWGSMTRLGDMASEVKEYIDEGLVNIIGGCCGTTEEYIAEYVPLVQKARPQFRQVSLSGCGFRG